MAKVVKNKSIYARVDQDLSERVNQYVERARGLDMAELVRLGVEEYMLNHPLPQEARV